MTPVYTEFIAVYLALIKASQQMNIINKATSQNIPKIHY